MIAVPKEFNTVGTMTKKCASNVKKANKCSAGFAKEKKNVLISFYKI